MSPIADFPWFSNLAPSQQKLVELTYFLYEREAKNHSEQTKLYDYSFVIFPLAKAYEGFLKQYLYDLQLIDQRTFEGKRFRIGRALNPDIRQSQRDEYWIYDDIELMCGKQVAHVLWQTWLQCRNRVVHFFPKDEHKITLHQAKERIVMVMETMDEAFACKVELDKDTYTAGGE